MLQSSLDKLFVMFGEHVFQQTVSILMGTNCASLLADLFLYSYEVDFILTFCYIDDFLSLNNSKFGDWWFCWSHLSHWDWNKGYHRYSLGLDLHLEIDSEDQSKMTKEVISIFPLWTFHLYVAILQQHLHVEYISLSWSDIPELVVPIMISLIEGCCYQWRSKGSYMLSHHF
jgi:hypothetical protein